MKKRLLVLTLLAALPLPADPEQDITNVLSTLASALSENNPQLFLRTLDHAMPAYHQIEHDLTALIADTNVGCTIELIRNSGSDAGQQADLDWYMILSSQQDQNVIERRRTKVTIKMEKRGKKWLITSFTPLTLFKPMAP